MEALYLKQKSNEYKLLTELYFRLLPYQVLLLAINAINGIVDTLYASNVIGKAAMSAIGIFGPINIFLSAASLMLVSGSQILYGRYVTTKREKLPELFTVDLLIALGISLLSTAVLALAVATGLTRLLLSQQPDLQMLNRYILGQLGGIPPLLMGQQLFSFLSLQNQTRRTMIASVASFLSNIVFNHLFIVIFPMGTFGLGLGTALSNWVFFGIQAVYFLRRQTELRFSLRTWRREEGTQIIRLGYPGAIARFGEMLRCLIVNSLVLKYVGSVGISSFSASNSLLSIIWAVPFGMAAVCRMLFSISIGEEDRRSLVNTMKITMTKGMLLMFMIVALLILLAEPLTRLFYREPADPVYHMTVMGFRLLPLCMPWSMISIHFACYAQTAEKRRLAVVLPVVDGVIGVVLFSFLLIPSMKMNGLYIANSCNGMLCAAVVVVDAWISRGSFPRNLEELMAIPERIGVPENERIDISVNSMAEVVSVSQQIGDFCLERGIDRRRAYFAGLCMEEMAGNVIKHGFGKDGKKNHIDIRVVHKGDNMILRIRDNCTAFNPAERANAMEPGETGKNIGIRMVYKIAGDVSYQNLLGLNVLTIRI